MIRIALVTTAVVLLGPLALEGQLPEERLQGAWRVVEMGVDGLPDRDTGPPQPGLLLFAGNHYSYTLVTRARPALPPGVASSAEVLAAWTPFTANAGTFEVSGDSMVRRPIVAKAPDAMGPGIYNEYTYRLSADTLWITTVGTETGPSPSPNVVRYERVR